MLSEAQVEILAEKAVRLCTDVGIEVENDEVTKRRLDKGCRPGAGHRIKIPAAIIDEMVAFQRQSQAGEERDLELCELCGPDWSHHLWWTERQDAFRHRYQSEFLMQAFDCGPTVFYDEATDTTCAVNTEIFDMMMKFAQATPEVGYTSMWYRQDRPPMVERLESLRRAMDFTDKFAGIEAIYPAVVKYLKEASEILTGDAKSSCYLAGSECMTMPLILEKRSAEDILERKKHGVNRYHVASMPTLGISTPVTLAGSIVMGAAELLGGMAVCWCVDPESDISARMITLVADMCNGNSTTFGPVGVQYNNAVRQIFNQRWGGHCMVEVFFSPTARRPGLQAVFENWYGTTCRRRWDHNPNIPYAGMGTLHNGGLGSPAQFMLDMEIRKAEWTYAQEIAVDDNTLDWDEVLSVTRDRGNFLTSGHTLAHCRDLWCSDYFRSDDPFAGTWDGTEKTILDRCGEAVRGNLDTWAPGDYWPDDKKAAIDAVIARARREFGVD